MRSKSKVFFIYFNRELVLDDYDNEGDDNSIKFTMNGVSNVNRENSINKTFNTAPQTKNIIDEITDIFGTSSINSKPVVNDLNIFGNIDLTTTSGKTGDNTNNTNNNGNGLFNMTNSGNTGSKTNPNDLLSTLGAVTYKTKIIYIIII